MHDALSSAHWYGGTFAFRIAAPFVILSNMQSTGSLSGTVALSLCAIDTEIIAKLPPITTPLFARFSNHIVCLSLGGVESLASNACKLESWHRREMHRYMTEFSAENAR